MQAHPTDLPQRELKLKKFFVSLCFVWIGLHTIAVNAGCFEDTLSKNNGGKILQTMGGHIFETMAGEYIDAMLWLPVSDLMICNRQFSYKGKSYEIFKITNLDDNESVDALKISSGKSGERGSSSCYESQIMKPSPFLGNHDEIFVLSDGSVWTVQFEYEYMYEYYPSATVCESQGFMIVDDKKLAVRRLR